MARGEGSSRDDQSERMRQASEAFQLVVSRMSVDQRQVLTEIREWMEAWFVEVGIRGLFHILLGS